MEKSLDGFALTKAGSLKNIEKECHLKAICQNIISVLRMDVNICSVHPFLFFSFKVMIAVVNIWS